MECNISPIQEDSSKGSAIQESVIIAVDDGPVLEVLVMTGKLFGFFIMHWPSLPVQVNISHCRKPIYLQFEFILF